MSSLIRNMFGGSKKTVDHKDIDFKTIRKTFIEYISSNSSILILDDFSKDKYDGKYIGYDCGYKKGDFRHIYLSAAIEIKEDECSNATIRAALVIDSNSEYLETHYKVMEGHMDKIKSLFDLDGLSSLSLPSTNRLVVSKYSVDFSRSENWRIEFQWLRENLEKLYWVLRVHDTIQY